MKNKSQTIKEIKKEEKELKHQEAVERRTRKLAEKISKMSEAEQLNLAKKLTNRLKILNAEMKDRQELEENLTSLPKQRNINNFAFGVIMVADALILGGCAAAVTQLFTDNSYAQVGATILGMSASVPASIGPLYLIENKPLSNAITKIRLKKNKNKQENLDKKIYETNKKLSIATQCEATQCK